MFTAWQIRFLGGFSARRGDEVVERLRTHTVLALFAFLCAQAGRNHGREELVARFWPDADDETGRTQLRVALNALRRAFEPPPLPSGSVLETTRTHVRLRPESVQTDVRAFEAALKKRDFAAALRVYEAGPFLPGVYDEWACEERERLEALADQARSGQTSAQKFSPAPLVPATFAQTTGMGDLKFTESLAAEPTVPPSRLPLLLDRFFGREAELARLEMLLVNPGVRLVCVTGPGGVGKTRIALEAARRLLTDKAGRAAQIIPGGAYFVPLAALTEPAQVAHALPILLRDAFDLPASGAGDDPLQVIETFLNGRRALIVLDNAEQIADALSLALPTVLARLSSLTFLVTTRARLSLRGAQNVLLGPLGLPPSEDAPLGEVASSEAVALFVDRARQAQGDWGLTVRNAPDVVALARLLDGSPLALELAASWAGVFTPRQMREQIACQQEDEPHRLDALPSRREQGRVERHRSLRATVAWSYHLLPPDLQTTWARLAVFRGGWTTDAAQSVCEMQDAPSHLARLIGQSLCTALPEDGDILRLDMPQVLREFAGERLAERNDVQTRQARHADWLLSAVADAPGETRTTAIHRAGLDNCRAALRFLLACFEPERRNDGLRMCHALWEVWYGRGFWDEAKAAFNQALTHAGENAPSKLRESAWRALGGLALYRAEHEAARRAFECQLAIARTAKRTSSIAAALSNLAAVSAAEGNFADARDHTAELLQATRANPDAPPLLLANLLNNLGTLSSMTGNEEAARDAFNEGVIRFRALGDAGRMGEGACLNGLGAVASALKNYEEALEHFTAAIAVFEQGGEVLRAADTRMNRAGLFIAREQWTAAAADLAADFRHLQKTGNPEEVKRILNRTAALAAGRQRWREAARLCAAYDAWQHEHHLMPPPDEARELQQLQAKARVALGTAAYEKACTMGRSWSRDTLIGSVLAEIENAQVPHRERNVLPPA